ncbi:hypothetical protein GCM10023174_14240 [Chelativorans composti]|jgi:hypothetical protein|uniref:Uncharacterized protein n=1 Tax=Chelativorans composti TaxID=768533 RepID=A0ABW5DEA0_9HYPH
MPSISVEELEGRLNAQRQVLAILLSWAERQGADVEALLAPLTEAGSSNDHQEDPGAVPVPAFAIEGARGREIRLILEEARAIGTTTEARKAK